MSFFDYIVKRWFLIEKLKSDFVMGKIFKHKTGLIVFIVFLVIAGLSFLLQPGRHADAGAPEGHMGAPQAMPVTVSVMKKEQLRLWSSFSGRLTAVDFVEIRPQVDGRIDEIRFDDGDHVEKDDVLFVIDPRPYSATAAEAQAALDGAKSQHELAEKELKRAEDLIKTEAISQKVLDERRNAAQVAENTLAAAQALLDKALIDLDRAYVKAPISGKVSRAEITVGNLVETVGGAPVLTTIVSDKGIYADFDVDEQTYLQRIRQKAKGDSQRENGAPVRLFLSDGSTYDGHIQSFDNRINTSTGTIRARAYFDNKDGALLPGMFVTVKLGSSSKDEAILLTEQAIGTDQDRKFVYVVGEDGMVAYRVVKLGASVDGKRIITSGLNEGEKVIVEGTIKVMPGMTVIPQEVGTLLETAPAAGTEAGEE